MARRITIPIYSTLSPKHRQYVNMVAGGLAMLCVALLVSGMIGGPEVSTAPPKDLPKPRPVAGAPGAQLDAKDAWMGGAGKEIARLRDDVKKREDEAALLRGELKSLRDKMDGELQALRERGMSSTPAPQPASTTPSPLLNPRPVEPSGAGQPRPAAGGAGPVNGPMSFPAQQPTDRLPAPNGRGPQASAYPPGTPMAGGRQVFDGAPGPMVAPAAPALMRVSVGAASGAVTADSGAASTGAAPGTASPGGPKDAKPVRTLANFLPVGFTRAVLLGGLAAPTGGQAQSNPVPVLLRLADLSVLPNGYRAQVKDCLVIGEGYGDHSAERAYIRATLLSCVMNDGQVLERPIKGSIFGEDGMNGMKGKLVTKQGAILGNALLSGLASGIGQGVFQASQVVNTTALGTVTSAPKDTETIARQGIGTGVSRAMDRLAQYYISLAERTFPVIEVQPGRIVDVVIQQGITLDVAIASIGPGASTPPTRGTAPDNNRSSLSRLAVMGRQGEEDEE